MDYYMSCKLRHIALNALGCREINTFYYILDLFWEYWEDTEENMFHRFFNKLFIELDYNQISDYEGLTRHESVRLMCERCIDTAVSAAEAQDEIAGY